MRRSQRFIKRAELAAKPKCIKCSRLGSFDDGLCCVCQLEQTEYVGILGTSIAEGEER